MSFLKRLLNAVGASLISELTAKEYGKLKTKLKSSKVGIKITGWIEWIVGLYKHTSLYFKEGIKPTNYVKVYQIRGLWYWELQDLYSNPIDKSTQGFDTAIESTNNLRGVIGDYEVLLQEQSGSFFICSIVVK